MITLSQTRHQRDSPLGQAELAERGPRHDKNIGSGTLKDSKIVSEYLLLLQVAFTVFNQKTSKLTFASSSTKSAPDPKASEPKLAA